MSNFSKGAIFSILAIALYGTLDLVRKEYLIENICPKLLEIPACYIILTCLLLALISQLHWLKDRHSLYWIGVIPAIGLASYGTLGELFNFAECPKTDGGIPLCFISLAIFISLLIFKIIELRSAHLE